MKEILLITPPFTQLNTPYPATSYLKGFLNTKNISSFQMDLGIEVILKLFSKENISKLFELAAANGSIHSENCQRIYAMRAEYLQPLDDVIRFLQGRNSTFARILSSDGFLPQASRFHQLDDMEWAFGAMGIQDKAKHYATLYLEDLSDFIVECIDPHFGFSRYAERLGRSANSFDELWDFLKLEPTYIDKITLSILDERINEIKPAMVCFSVPFPGNLYSAFRCAQHIRKNYPEVAVAMGGGFPNTELRSLSDIRVFEFFNYITLDDGELPIELLINIALGSPVETPDLPELKRTFHLYKGAVFYNDLSKRPDYRQAETGTPDYSDLLLDEYISVIEIANPMHSLWSDGRWNKLTMAHGCYWGKCTFCDVSLDYIKRYEPVAAVMLADRMQEIIEQTGENGFHFVDEAAPPALMKALAIEIIRRKLSVTWWTNIRFEKNFTQDLCYLLKASGCIAVSGGLEVASDRLLKLIDKGVTVEQVARVTRNFTEAGIMVHAYLMYGYPTQTVSETVDSLEMVRQLFEIGVIQSGFWHQFALTAHSPVGMNPTEYGIMPSYNEISFANNDVLFEDSTGIDHSAFGFGLKKSLFNYMHGIGFDKHLQFWFDFKIPKTTVNPDYIVNCLDTENDYSIKPNARMLWLGTMPAAQHKVKTRKGKTYEQLELSFHDKLGKSQLSIEKEKGEWLMNILEKLRPQYPKRFSFTEIKSDFEAQFDDFELFWWSKPIQALKAQGLLLV